MNIIQSVLSHSVPNSVALMILSHDLVLATLLPCRLVNEYNSNPLVIHIDCYREQDLNRWQSIGIQEYFESGCIVFIEWAEFIKPLLPNRVIPVSFLHIAENRRKINIF